MRSVLRLTIILAMLSSLACAQSTYATLTGRVVDPTNSVVVEAKVEAVSLNTNLHYSGETNSEGLFTIPGVPPGPYRIEASKAGFRTMVREDVVLRVQDIVALNFTLSVGSASETITVTGGAPVVDTQTAAVSTVVDQSYVQNMPLNGRSFQDLILLTPGVVTASPQLQPFQVRAGAGQQGEFSVNGQRTEENYYTVDGVSANVGANGGFYGTTGGPGASGSVPGSTALGTTQALVSVEDLQEFRVQSSTYSAQYGRNPGGQFAFETKSGTNQWHGAAYDYLRNDLFDATDYFTNYLRSLDPTLKKTAVRQNDFGGTFGGPVQIPHLFNGRDKTFFFVSYEGLRLRSPQPAGIFPVPDATLRANTLAPLNQVLNAFPLPTPGTPDLDQTNHVGQFIGTWSNPSSINSTSIRFDHAVTGKLGLFFRFTNVASNSASRGFFGFASPSEYDSTPFTLRTYTVGANSIFTHLISNEFRLNYSSNVSSNPSTITAFGGSTPTNLVQLAGVQAPNPSVAVDMFLGAYVLQMTQGPTAGAQRQWNLVDTVHAQWGRHQLNVGADYRRLTPYDIPYNPLILYFFSDPTDVENNQNAYHSSTVYGPAYPLYKNFSLFAEDEWKVATRLNLSLGLRWEVNPPPGAARGLLPYTVAFQSPDPNSWTTAPQGTRLWKTTWANFAPRLGAAYVLHDAAGWETVLRGGGGLFFDTGQQLGSSGFQGPGFNSTNVNFTDSFPGSLATPQLGPPSTPYFALTGFHPHLQLPYTIQWNASLEQALGSAQALTISYVGSRAGRLLQQNEFKSSNSIDNIHVVQNGLKSYYDSAQIQFRRRLSRGLTALASYTWSHCLDYGSTNIQFGYQKGNCGFDVRHNLSTAFSYDLPNAGHGTLADSLLHHWGIDERFSARTAFPVTLTGNNHPQPNGKVYDGGVSFVKDEPVYLYGSNCAAVLQGLGFLQPGQGCPGGRAINPNAFEVVDSGYGDTPRNFARGFSAWQMDLAVRREFPIHERLKLQFRAEAFNVFNHPNFGSVSGFCGGTPGVPGCTFTQFGQATATLANSLGVLSPLYQMGGSRSMQFALKLIF